MQDTIYVICVNQPGYLPESDPYAVSGEDSAWTCAHHELADGDAFPYSRDEWWSALQAGGASIYLESGYVVEVTPLDSLGLGDDDRDEYERQARGED